MRGEEGKRPSRPRNYILLPIRSLDDQLLGTGLGGQNLNDGVKPGDRYPVELPASSVDVAGNGDGGVLQRGQRRRNVAQLERVARGTLRAPAAGGLAAGRALLLQPLFESHDVVQGVLRVLRSLRISQAMKSCLDHASCG